MNTNMKGVFAESLAVHEFFKHGFSVYKPFHDYSPVDLLVSKDLKTILRIQVKYRCIEKGLFTIPTHSVLNGKKVPNDLSLIDAWACYIPDYSKLVFVSKDEFENGKFHLRFEEPKKKTSQAKLVSDLSVYTDPNRIWRVN